MADRLSPREQAVIALLRQGNSNKEIGRLLEISPRTVQKHVQHMYRHLNVQTRVEAIVQTRKRDWNRMDLLS